MRKYEKVHPLLSFSRANACVYLAGTCGCDDAGERMFIYILVRCWFELLVATVEQNVQRRIKCI